MKHADIIAALGGIGPVAAELGRHRCRVGAWRTGGIPTIVWPAIVAMAARRGVCGITFEALQLGQASDEPVPALPRGRKPATPQPAA